MIKNRIPGLPSFLSTLLLICCSTFAAEPPEIINISFPTSFVLNGVGGEESAISGDALATDAAGNTYVSGKFNGKASLNSIGITNTGAYGSPDVYLAKYDSSHTPVWVRTIRGADSEFGKALAVNAAGEIYLAGTSTSSLLTFPGKTNVLANLFLAKYSSAGDVLWVQTGGSWYTTNLVSVAGNMDVSALALDNNEFPVLVGHTSGKPMIGGHPVSTYVMEGGVVLTNKGTGNNSLDLYLAKFSPAGVIQWAKNYGSTNNEYTGSLAIGPDNDIYVTGTFDKSTTLGASNYTTFKNGACAIRFSETGDVKWSASYGQATDTYQSYGRSIVVDKNGRLTVAIQTGVTVFSVGAFSITNLVTGPVFDPVYMGILIQYLPDGTLAKVVRTPFNASGYGDVNHSLALVIDQNNSLILRTDSSLMTSVNAFGKSGLSFLKYDSQLTPIWTNRVAVTGGSTLTQYRSSHAYAFDATGHLHIAATFKADKGTRLQLGWNSVIPFTAYGDQLVVFEMAPTFQPVAPQFVQQPASLYFQTPQGWTNFGLARAVPAPTYQWFQNGKPLPNATNQFLFYTSATLTNRGDFYLVAANSYGSATSLVAQVKAALTFDVIPPASVSVLTNSSVTLTALASGLEPITYRWTHAGTNLPGATGPNLQLQNFNAALAGSYTVVASNSSGSITSAPPSVLKLVDFGATDPSITYSGFQGGVQSFVLNTDQSIIAADSVNAIRFNALGSLDTTSFTNLWRFPGESVGVKGILPNGDGKYIVFGDFFRYVAANGTVVTPATRIARLNADGSLDNTFNVGVGPTNSIDGLSFSRISSVVKLPDGKYLVGGMFNKFNGLAMTNIARLNANGTLDETFARHSFRSYTNQTSMGTVSALALTSDGKILVAGSFSLVDTFLTPNLVRLNSDGSIDNTFPAPPVPFPPFGSLATIQIQTDGKILIAGNFARTDNSNRAIVRLNADGTPDAAFTGTSANGINAIYQQADGKLILGTQNGLARLQTNGVLDAAFKSQITNPVYALAGDNAGHLYAGGSFGLARLLIETFVDTSTPATVSPDSVILDATGVFHFTVCGSAGQKLKIQVSTDFVKWDDYATQTVANECLNVTDTQVHTHPARYYRVLVIP